MVCLIFQLVNLRFPRRPGSIWRKKFDIHQLKSEPGISAVQQLNAQDRVKVYQYKLCPTYNLTSLLQPLTDAGTLFEILL